MNSFSSPVLRPWQLGAGHQGSLRMRFEESREVSVPDDDCVSGANTRSTIEEIAQVLNTYFRTVTTSKPIGCLPSVLREDNFCEYAKCLAFSRNPFKFHTFFLTLILLSGIPPDGGTSVICGAQSALPRHAFVPYGFAECGLLLEVGRAPTFTLVACYRSWSR